MKTINEFLAERESMVLTEVELISVRGGDKPPKKPTDPWKTLSFFTNLFSTWFN